MKQLTAPNGAFGWERIKRQDATYKTYNTMLKAALANFKDKSLYHLEMALFAQCETLVERVLADPRYEGMK